MSIGIEYDTIRTCNTLIGEFNIAGGPTTAANKTELETLFGVKWTGWRGTYFNDLTRDIDVPTMIVEQYENKGQKTWDYTGKGYVLISDDGKIVVLQEGIHIKKNGLKVIFGENYRGEFQINKAIAYHYWFEFVTPKLGRETIANYQMDLTEEGQKIMKV